MLRLRLGYLIALIVLLLASAMPASAAACCHEDEDDEAEQHVVVEEQEAPVEVVDESFIRPEGLSVQVINPSEFVIPGEPAFYHYVDLGHTAGDPEIIEGFCPPENANIPAELVAGQPDYTKRKQIMGVDNSLLLSGFNPDRPIHLVFAVTDGLAQDNWRLIVKLDNGDEVDLGSNWDGLEPREDPVYYYAVVPASAVTDNTIVLTFRNTSTDIDGAAVWGVAFWQYHR